MALHRAIRAGAEIMHGNEAYKLLLRAPSFSFQSGFGGVPVIVIITVHSPLILVGIVSAQSHIFSRRRIY